MKTLEIDLNKLSDEGILRFVKLKQEINAIREKEFNQQNKWMPQQKNTDMPPPPAFAVGEDEYDDDVDDGYNDED